MNLRLKNDQIGTNKIWSIGTCNIYSIYNRQLNLIDGMISNVILPNSWVFEKNQKNPNIFKNLRNFFFYLAF